MANEYEDLEKVKKMSKKEALKQARIALAQTYNVDLNATDIVQAVKDLGIDKFEKALTEIKNFIKSTDAQLVESKDAAQIGMVMNKARTTANWDNPLYNYVEDIA